MLGLLSCEKKTEDNEPVAIFNVDPVAGPFTTAFIFDASDTHMEGESPEELMIRWDWEGDGLFDTEYSYQKIKSHQYEDAGDFIVRMQVMNSKGWTDTEEFPITVYPDSVPPVASFCVTPDTATIMTLFRFNTASSWDAYEETKELLFRWDWDSDGCWETPYSTDTCTYKKFTTPGTYRVTMEVKNYVNLTDTTSRLIYVSDI